MKTDAKFWHDTGNLDLQVAAENPTEEAVLGLLVGRMGRIVQRSEGVIEVVLTPTIGRES